MRWGACSTRKIYAMGCQKLSPKAMLCDLCPIADFFTIRWERTRQSKNRGATEVKLCTVLVVSMMDVTAKSKVKWSDYNNGSAIQG